MFIQDWQNAVVSLCINPRMVEPNDPYKKLILGGMMLSNYENLIYIKPLQENLGLNVATDEESHLDDESHREMKSLSWSLLLKFLLNIK